MTTFSVQTLTPDAARILREAQQSLRRGDWKHRQGESSLLEGMWVSVIGRDYHRAIRLVAGMASRTRNEDLRQRSALFVGGAYTRLLDLLSQKACLALGEGRIGRAKRLLKRIRNLTAEAEKEPCLTGTIQIRLHEQATLQGLLERLVQAMYNQPDRARSFGRGARMVLRFIEKSACNAVPGVDHRGQRELRRQVSTALTRLAQNPLFADTAGPTGRAPRHLQRVPAHLPRLRRILPVAQRRIVHAADRIARAA